MIPQEGLHPPVEDRIMSKSQGPALYVSELSQEMATAGTRSFGGLEDEGPLYGPGRTMQRWVQGRSEGGEWVKLPTLDASAIDHLLLCVRPKGLPRVFGALLPLLVM